MRNGIPRLSMIMTLCLLFLGVTHLTAIAKVPEGFRDIKLGMNKSQVLEALQKSPVHVTYDDMGTEIGEIIRGDELFRYATYKFDGEGILVEIGLQMREILGRDRCLEIYNTQNGLQVSPLKSTVESGITLEVKENSLVMKRNKETRSAKKDKVS
jgi:hypothetical protein